MLLSIVVIATKVWEYHESLKIELTPGMIVQMGICCVLYALVVYMCPHIYRGALFVTTGKKVSYVKVADTYCKSNIMKYLPGNVMQYVGRNEIALKEELSHGEVALATALEIIVTIISSAVIAAIFSWEYAVEWITHFVNIDVRTIVLVFIVIIVTAVVVIIAFWEKLHDYIKSLITLKNVWRILVLIAYASLIMILNSIIYYYTLSVLGIQMEMRYYFIGIGLYSLSFVLGYVTPGVPGGIGIREAVMVYFFSTFMKESDVLTGALIFRIISIIGDFIGLGIAFVVSKKCKTDIVE